MTTKTTLTLVDGTRVVVPDSLDLITPYVLMEQEDWFEDEIKFLRRLLKPGQKVIDIGANYGVYSLSMARTIGPEGQVWAFEPASETAGFLADGIAANGFSQVSLQKCALSSESGTARLSLHPQSELNALVHGDSGEDASEAVPVRTLDECMDTFGWSGIAFIKIDAEGEEENIIKGGARFFGTLSPLVQYEVKAGHDLHFDLVRLFASIGYESFRLVPGLNLLVPFEVGSTAPDAYLLNLFCCKSDRIALLAAEGFLVTDKCGDFRADANAGDGRYPWRESIGKLPYATRLRDTWEQTVASGAGNVNVLRALELHARSRDLALLPWERYCSLQAAMNLLDAVCREQPSNLRLASLARVAREYGARGLAVSSLSTLIQTIFGSQRVEVGEPFLPPGERFDTLAPGDALEGWILTAVLEEFERAKSFSSFYIGLPGLDLLRATIQFGLSSPEMARRLELVQRRFGVTSP